MGWSWLEEALDAQEQSKTESNEEEAELSDELEFDEDDEPLPDPAKEGIDWVHDGRDRVVHPISKHANDALHAMLDELKAAGHFPDCDDEALGDFVGHFMNLSAKLAGALGSLARGGHTADGGLIIAWLKRALEIHNQALLAAKALEGSAFFPNESLGRHRAELFAIREEMLGLIARLREERG